MADQKLNIQRIYLKGSSFETIGTPQLFRSKLDPKSNIEFKINPTALEQENHHEVVLEVTVTTNSSEEDKQAFIANVKQAGVFKIEGFEGEQLKQILHTYCANVLYPYARQILSELTLQGTFPPITLAPINFDVIYKQQQEAQQKEEEPVTVH